MGAVLAKSRVAIFWLDTLLIANYLPWFVAGAGFYWWQAGQRRAGVSAVLLGFAALGAAAIADRRPAGLIAALLIFVLVGAALHLPPTRRVLSGRFISAIGVSSYSLYLLHQRIGVVLIGTISNALRLSPYAACIVPVVVAAGFMALALLIYHYWENPLNARLVGFFAGTSRSAI